MVSTKLTEEEEFLKKQFQALKELKKELKQLTLKRKQEEAAAAENGPPSAKQKKAIIQGSKTPTKQHSFFSGGPSYNIKSPSSLNAAANTEAAKKLLKSGAIQLKVEKKTTFKRSSTFKRKLIDTDNSARSKSVSQQFMASNESTEDDISDDHDPQETKPEPVKTVFKSYSAGKEGKTRFVRKDRKGDKKTPRRGNTLYVYGFAVNETMVKQHFSKFGNLVNINVEQGKTSCFVTYDSFESAESAIKEMNDALVEDCRLKVTIARHQPMLQLVKTNTPWDGLAERGDKGSMEGESRAVVNYAEEDYFG